MSNIYGSVTKKRMLIIDRNHWIDTEKMVNR